MVNLLLLFFLGALACETNNDCPSNNVCTDHSCVHKSLFPLDGIEILGSFMVFISSSLANAGGIGGGPLMVTILITIFSFDAYESVPLSQLIIFGGSLTAIAIKIFLRHPKKNRPLIDFDIALLLCSPLLLGATIGVIINLSIAQWLILLLMSLILLYISIDTLLTAIKVYKRESKAIKDNKKNLTASHLNPESAVLNRHSVVGPEETDKKDKINPELLSIKNTEKKIVPPKSLILIGIIYSFVALTSFVRGSKTFKSIFGLNFCSAWYWVVTAAILIVLVLAILLTSYMMINQYAKKTELLYTFDSKDLKWTKRNMSIVTFTGFLAGIASGIIGVGGGLILNPVMLRLEIRPEVSTATSSFMVLFTSSISMLQYAIAGKLNIYYGLWTVVFSLIGSCLGILVIKKLVDKYKRSSIIVMLLALIMATCAVIIPTYGILNYLNSKTENGFRNFCE